MTQFLAAASVLAHSDMCCEAYATRHGLSNPWISRGNIYGTIHHGLLGGTQIQSPHLSMFIREICGQTT